MVMMKLFVSEAMIVVKETMALIKEAMIVTKERMTWTVKSGTRMRSDLAMRAGGAS
jgi:hypothetical protein